MQLSVETTNLVLHLYEESKFWAALIGALWTAFKGFNWVKDIREKDLKGIQSGVNTLTDGLQKQTVAIETGLHNQTTSLVGQLQELRSDFRTFYTAPDPIMIPVHARGSRKKASVAARSKAKSSAPKKTAKAAKQK